MKKSLVASGFAAGLSFCAITPALAALIIDTSGPYAAAGQIGDFGVAGHDQINDNDALIKNPLYGPGTLINGWFGANLKVDRKSTLVFEFLGKEASYLNSVVANFGGETLKSTDKVGASFVITTAGAGWVDFSFNIDKTPKNGVANADLTVKNGANNSHLVSKQADFWLGYDPKFPHAVLVALDDGGAKPKENDHDDMLIRIRSMPVPEPMTLSLLGLALAGLGLRRKG